jgi:hypothetical protein
MHDDSALTQEMAIQERVQQALGANEKTAQYPIEVAVQGATVSLFGTVDSHEAKDTAEQLARGVPGVVDVTNELVIDENAGKDGGWLGLGRDREGGEEVPPVVGAAGLANRGGAAGTGAGVGQQGAGVAGVPLAAAELAGATEDVQREAEESGEEPGS